MEAPHAGLTRPSAGHATGSPALLPAAAAWPTSATTGESSTGAVLVVAVVGGAVFLVRRYRS